MIPIVSFIGWQNSGKTTIAQQVVGHLKERGYRVWVIKSTHHTSLHFDREGSDSRTYCKACADTVSLLAPDQMVTIGQRPEMKLTHIVDRFVHDADIVIGEGFKNERHIAKIEVTTGDSELLKDQVNGVVALVTDRDVEFAKVFLPSQSGDITDFIENEYLLDPERPETETVLFVNGSKVPMKGFVQDALAGTIHGFVSSLKKTDDPDDIEVRIKIGNNPKSKN
jgi:molybdopterin-guanine dinucleotide biosynthesis protein B